jgi:hypothetical protein
VRAGQNGTVALEVPDRLVEPEHVIKIVHIVAEEENVDQLLIVVIGLIGLEEELTVARGATVVRGRVVGVGKTEDGNGVGADSRVGRDPGFGKWGGGGSAISG